MYEVSELSPRPETGRVSLAKQFWGIAGCPNVRTVHGDARVSTRVTEVGCMATTTCQCCARLFVSARAFVSYKST